MESTVLFRDFEERDIEFIYKWKNDEKLNHMIVGPFYPITHEEAQKWVEGCIGEHETYKFWAICTNDDEKRIIGWASIAKIDKVNMSASTHSMVIADSDYHDGLAWLEAHLLMFSYVFDVLKLNRLYGVSLVGHKDSNFMGNLLFMKTEGILRQAIFKNNRYYDLQYDGILKEEFFSHRNAGDYELKTILRRLKRMRKYE
jgi:RimJ/RimL family protein N-acetyltransferase